MVTNYFKQLIAQKLFCVSGSNSLPSKCYLGLSTSTPTASGSYTEPSAGTGYSRIDLTTGGLLSYDTTNNIVYNNSTVTFGEALSSWGTVTHYAVFDSSTRNSGHLLAYGQLTASKSIVVGDIPRVPTNALQISITDS